ncbi:hypothetical protein LS684_15815 [Cytobacillus spongiae]|jgi:hypothetical protein|uniref:hypothetical protein n=1 Tax=Cytobacillus spongiae TaxID=2901381 RepID=UPI001F217765|nr:hypothetical protein [Cytobacillus spongiae]UII55110.1 hypothetical protein LS684_15815 [Cytobacillus spongiae]
MKKRDLRRIFAGFMLAGTVLVGCSANETNQTEEPKEQTEEAEKKEEVVEFDIEATAAAQQVKAYADMKAELEKMKEDKEVDWELVSKTYSGSLQAAVNELDGEFDQTIQAAIEAGTSGEIDQNIARQLIDKTTQSYLYQKQKSLHKDVIAALEADNKEEATAAFEQIKYMANEVFIPTATKRDEYYELTGEKSLVENINSGIEAQGTALEAGNLDDFKVYIQLTDKSIYRSYYLASNSYAEKIAVGVAEGKTELELQQMQAEAFGFLQAIKGSLSGGDEAAATKLNELFSLDQTKAADINVDEVNALFVQALVGKIKSYHEKAPASLDEGNVTDARISALEGNMFLKAIELKLIEAVGEEKAIETFTTAEAWLEAVSSENVEEAKKHSDAVLSVVNGL